MNFNLILIVIWCFFRNSKGSKYEKDLIRSLFNDYEINERPVFNHTDLIRVQIGLKVQQILEIDEKSQTLLFIGWVEMLWQDQNLEWNPNDFGNITLITIPSSKLWKPDIVLYNSADRDSFDPKSDCLAILSYTGQVSYYPPNLLKVICSIEVDEFPFDEQKCSLKFGSWAQSYKTVGLEPVRNTVDLESYVINSEWNIEKTNAYNESKKFECCPEEYVFAVFEIYLRRRSLYYIFNLILPCFMISTMSFVSFLLPPESGEKVGLEITTLLSIIMFSQLILNNVPESSLAVPRISIYFCLVSLICAISIYFNVIVLNLYHRSNQIQGPLPKWIQKFVCVHLAKLLRMKQPQYLKLSNKFNDFTDNNNEKHELISKISTKEKCLNCCQTHMIALRNILNELQNKNSDKENNELMIKFSAMVIDRFCLWFISILTLLSTIFVLFTSKNFFKFT